MCQLLGMNCNVPTDICFSFTGFQARGGATDVHADGWGIAFFEGRGARVFLDPQPSCRSPIAALVRQYPIRSKNVVAHIRKATQGVVALENTHPFMREAWGRYWIFAHNGNLLGFGPALDGSFLPVGNTDSERAFCWLLQRLRQACGATPPSHERIFDVAREVALEVGALGEFNFLLAGSDFLLAHASTQLAYIVRQAPFAQAHLKDEDVTVDFSEVTTPDDRVAVIATVPLTDNEDWQTMPPGTLWLFAEGEPVRQAATVPGAKRKAADAAAGDQERS
ncbi:class II glutamine amidotransferase [Azospira restricta]|uniref:Class II glutamine amidotransferase n=1 Tax=Azospira restricta TaxID=404405 RepID=A0A974SNS6_9RHOO|nr:class II glutamine amidotransferase [Azospira restricta]QRJ63669.1 class II glutamine amidotransferase [Azospira restricta]